MTLLVPQNEGIPLPRPNPLTTPFWEGCAEGRLLFQRCANCAAAVFNPAPICPRCHSRRLEWEESSGVGTIYSWTVAYRPLSPKFTDVYAPVIIDLAEGYQMVSNVIGCDIDDLAVRLPVRVDFHAVGDFTLPYFRPGAPELA